MNPNRVAAVCLPILPFAISIGLIVDPNMERHNMLGWIMFSGFGLFFYSAGVLFTACPCGGGVYGHKNRCLLRMYDDGEPIPWLMFARPVFWPIYLFGIFLPRMIWRVVSLLAAAVWSFLKFPLVNHRRIQRAKYKDRPAPKEGAYR